VTGIPLPFFSYGGSSTISMMAMAGIVINVGLRRYEYWNGALRCRHSSIWARSGSTATA